MSTRAIYTFRDNGGDFHIYKHHDGYPEGAKEFITKAMECAWTLPRFEADEFAAAFVAANKGGEGSIRICNTEPWKFAVDADYWYVITCENGKLVVEAMDVNWWDDVPENTTIYKGPLGSLDKAKN